MPCIILPATLMVVMPGPDLLSEGQPRPPVAAAHHLHHLQELRPDQVHCHDECLVVVPTLIVPLGSVDYIHQLDIIIKMNDQFS